MFVTNKDSDGFYDVIYDNRNKTNITFFYMKKKLGLARFCYILLLIYTLKRVNC